MSDESLSDLGDKLHVDEDVLAALGTDREHVAAMGLREFFEFATSRGFDIGVSTRRSLDDEGRLSILADTMRFPDPPLSKS